MIIIQNLNNPKNKETISEKEHIAFNQNALPINFSKPLKSNGNYYYYMDIEFKVIPENISGFRVIKV